MAASLSLLRQLTVVSRTGCLRCGNAINKVNGSPFRGQKVLTATHLVTQNFSATVKNVEETVEQDELYRQVTVEVKGHDKAVLKSYNQFVTMAANELGINLARSFEPPKVITRYSVLKSVHIYAKHMVQYEQRTHYNVFELKHLTGSTADTFLEYIQRNLPEGMAMKVTKHKIEKLPNHLQPPKVSSHSEPHAPAVEAS